MAILGKSSNKIKDELPLDVMGFDTDMHFFLEIIYNMDFTENSCEGFFAGVALVDKKIVIKVNLDKLKEMSVDDQIYILVHEASHVIFNHLIKAKHCSNLKVLNIAQDAVINSLINKHFRVKMPRNKNGEKIGIDLEFLKENNLVTEKDLKDIGKHSLEELTSDDIYEIIMKKMPSNGGGGGEDGDGNKNGNENNENRTGSNVNIDKIDKQRLDSHKDIFSNEDLDDETRATIDQLLKQAKSNMYGNAAGAFVRDLLKAIRKSFPFKQILDKVIYKEKYDFNREHRRIHLKDAYLPRKRSEKIKVYAMIDTSGSVYDYTEEFIGYIMALPEFEELILVDTKIQAIYGKNEIPKVIPGGGGTDLNPGFEHWKEIEAKNKGHKINFVCLTDGELPPITVGPTHSKVIILTTDKTILPSYPTNSKFLNFIIERRENNES